MLDTGADPVRSRTISLDLGRQTACLPNRSVSSQLLAVSEPPSLRDAHRRMGTQPVPADELEVLAKEMGPPDQEG